jgi:hypothetical protein
MTEEVREFIRLQVAMGFDEGHEIAVNAVECFEDEYEGDDLESLVATLLEQEWQEHLLAQPPDSHMSDCDRLDLAFAELESTGVVARQHFTCCQTCGNAEIGDEIGQTPGARGYVYYHFQDTESAVGGSGLCLCYGSVRGAPEAIGHEVVEALQRNGLKVSWDGDLAKRIRVDLRWKRRHLWLRAECASGELYGDPSENVLLELFGDVERGEEEYFVLTKPGSASSEVFSQVTLDDEARFVVEYRAGGQEHHYQAVTPDKRRAHAALTGWAFELDGWRDHLTWMPLGSARPPAG